MVEHETSTATEPGHRHGKGYGEDEEGTKERGIGIQSFLGAIDHVVVFFAEGVRAAPFGEGGQPCADAYGKPAAQVKRRKQNGLGVVE